MKFYLNISVLIALLNLPLLCFSENQRIDSLEQLLTKLANDTTRVRTLNKLAYEYEYISGEKAIKYAEEALDLSKKLNDTKGFIKSNTNLGFFYDDLGDFNKAIEYYKISLSELLKQKDDYEIADHYNFIGLCYNYLGDYLNAIQNFQDAITIYEAHNDSLEIAKCYLNTGLAHYNNKDFEKGEQYFLKSLGIKQRNNDPLGSAYCYLNLGNIFQLRGNLDNALDYFLKAEKLFGNCDRVREQSYVSMNIANVYQGKKNYEAAKAKFLELKKVVDETKDQNVESYLYINLGLAYSRLHKPDSALFYLHNAVEVSKEAGLMPNLKDAFMSLSNVYDSLKNADSTLKYLRLHFAISDSIYNLEKNKQLNELSTKYETEKKEQQIALQQSDIARKDFQKNALIAGLALMIFVALYVIYSLVQKRKANRLLSLKNAEIQQQKEEIQAQAEYLSETNNKLELMNQELEKLSIVASKTDNSIVIASPAGEIEWVNDAFSRIFGYNIDEFIKIFGNNILTASKNPNIKEAIESCIKNKETVQYSSLNETKDNKKVWVQTTLTPITDENGNIYKLVAIDSDISKLKEAEEEINQQKEELQAQSELLSNTNDELEKKNLQITDSIRYAKQIQDAMLPLLSPQFQSLGFEAFVFFKPKDIVSGDFYWFTQTENFTFFAVADCTGHGVPGAFMSMIGNTLLNEIVIQKRLLNLNEILIKLDEGVNFAINKQNNSETSQEDGMEISICRIDSKKKEIEIASTNQSVYIFNDEELTEIEGGLYSIGGSSFSNKTFESQTIKAKGNTNIYLRSDGYHDQFGGENHKKYGSSKLRELIISANEHSFSEQKNIFESEFNSWIGNNKQIDDVTIIGIKL